ncbi:LOW QUALITY PROTEIN: lutropin-choriogonadotropic hormone receptor-like [Coregonus clupeaformis]|uniref:LOW QUALITY PROTEIN: lutropin-choriogonadotropic hormone receptor-like n=1 Tax=Coregonus clupeaformis TaxID=59861 RepID=UPI001E1C6CB3|nr:LOW QUALITY PROTEIN: lutropin-choriogonadotropic hormone receptor-like [Coregonus clupeaformis]
MASAKRTWWVVLALSGVLNVSSCWTFTCPSICECSMKSDTCYTYTREKLSCTRETQLKSQATPSFIRNLRLTHLPLTEVPSNAFRGLINVSRIEISQSDCTRNIRSHAFLSLHSLAEIQIQNIRNLISIEKGAFTDLPRLRYLSICNTGIIHFPDFSTISSLVILEYFFLELGDNMQLHSIPANAFQGITEESVYMNIKKNGFKEIKSHAFNGTKLDRLILKDNRYLRNIHEDAFEGASGPTVLDVSSTALHTLPRRGLGHLKVLIARSTPYLKTLPPLESLLELEVAEVTYPSHCCAFHTWRRNREKVVLALSPNLRRLCDDDDEIKDNVTDLYDINLQYPDLQLSLCPGPFQCTPEPDAFNPCEDLLGYSFLRSVTWLMTVFAVPGNMAVLVVLIISHQKLSVSRFLMCNLAFADLCMGVYLLLIAAMDYHSRNEYYNYSTDWQMGTGCGVAGFLTVFASELSVYTLTMITLERCHTITNAMHKNKRLRLRHVMAFMAGGWGFSLLAALLPVLGVSSYTKVSICLPMDIESLASQVYVVALLLLNITAFFIVCYCYVRIYLSIHNPDLATRHRDSKIAKRMAVLIFTDFLCMAPISFFGISAALRMPLITVSHSKILLVLFYPINSLCNPFLYTIFTRSFRKDMRLLLSRCSCCHARAEFYRAQNLEAHTIPPKDRTTSPRNHTLRFYTYHHKMQGCFLCKGGGAT